mmetsp:Transcript_16009/g.39476  ORF Transcript_16009/g.39476 Transcript_16009/m.39476 type:complete len:110 (+) Transcript_16009:1247-1576(+)
MTLDRAVMFLQQDFDFGIRNLYGYHKIQVEEETQVNGILRRKFQNQIVIRQRARELFSQLSNDRSSIFLIVQLFLLRISLTLPINSVLKLYISQPVVSQQQRCKIKHAM